MIALKYSLFALIATGFNLLFQYLSLLVYADMGSLYLAMFLGTLVGLVCKYSLDKKFIFYHTPKSKAHDLKKFIAYTVTGIFTTVIFWGTEIEFNIYFKEEGAKYVGAIIGLSIGYIMKYFLDKQFVFKRKPQ